MRSDVLILGYGIVIMGFAMMLFMLAFGYRGRSSIRVTRSSISATGIGLPLIVFGVVVIILGAYLPD